jgi:hypothetical protein
MGLVEESRPHFFKRNLRANSSQGRTVTTPDYPKIPFIDSFPIFLVCYLIRSANYQRKAATTDFSQQADRRKHKESVHLIQRQKSLDKQITDSYTLYSK